MLTVFKKLYKHGGEYSNEYLVHLLENLTVQWEQLKNIWTFWVMETAQIKPQRLGRQPVYS